MSVFHKAMVWLGLVDDDEYYGDEDQYYVDEYGEPVGAPARQQPARVPVTVPAPSQPEQNQLTVARIPREREKPTPLPTPASPVRSAAVKPVAMPATRVHVMDPKGFNDAQE